MSWNLHLWTLRQTSRINETLGRRLRLTVHPNKCFRRITSTCWRYHHISSPRLSLSCRLWKSNIYCPQLMSLTHFWTVQISYSWFWVHNIWNISSMRCIYPWLVLTSVSYVIFKLIKIISWFSGRKKDTSRRHSIRDPNIFTITIFFYLTVDINKILSF